jgi:WD40 repeat protein
LYSYLTSQFAETTQAILNSSAPYVYKVGGTLAANAPSYVTRSSDDELYRALSSGEFCYVLNARQMGKSSLGVRTMQRLRQAGAACAFLEMTKPGNEQVSIEQWYNGVIAELVRGLQLKFNFKQWRQSQQQLSPVKQFNQFIEEVLLELLPQQPIVIFFDEIDSVKSLGFSTDDFFASLRACYNQRAHQPEYQRLTFCLLGVTTPSELIQDKQRTPFNIGQAITLTSFQEAAAQAALLPGLQGHIDQPDRVLAEILDWTGGQPFLTQKICKLVLQQPEQSVADTVTKQVINNWEVQDEPAHFKTIRDRLLTNPQLQNKVLGLYQEILVRGSTAFADSPAHQQLHLSGLVRQQEGQLRCYNPIYAAVFNKDWVAAELNKIRPYAEQIDHWGVDRDPQYLLRDRELWSALAWAGDRSLSELDLLFLSSSQTLALQAATIELEASQQRARQIEQRTRRQMRWGSIILAGSLLGAGWAEWTRERTSQVTNLELSSLKALREFQNNGQIEALLTAMKSGRELKKLVGNKPLSQYPTYGPLFNLQTIILNIRERQRLVGHDGAVSDVSWQPAQPNGQMIATAGTDYTIRLWQTKTFQNQAVLKGHRARVTSAQFSPNGQQLGSADGSGLVKLWSSTGRLLGDLMGHSKAVNSIVFSPNSQLMATAGEDRTIQIWSAVDRQRKRQILGHSDSIYQLRFSPDGRWLASASNDKTVKIWEVATGRLQQTLAGHSDGVYGVDFSPDGKTIATASADNEVHLWNWAQGNQIITLKGHRDRINDVRFSPDGKTLATASNDNTVRLWNRQDGTVISTLVGHRARVYRSVFSPDGKILSSASADGTVRLWQMATNKELIVPLRHDRPVNSAIFSPDGKTIASASTDKTVKLKNLNTGETTTINGSYRRINSAKFSPNGQLLAFGGFDQTVHVRNLLTNQDRDVAFFSGHKDRVNSLNFDPTGQMVASASVDGHIYLWESLTGKKIGDLTGHQQSVTHVAFNPSGKILASASEDNTVKLWAVDQRQEMTTLRGHNRRVNYVSFSPNGKFLATASNDGTVKLWSTNSWKLLKTLDNHHNTVVGVAFSPDSQIVASASTDSTINLWRLDGGLIGTLSEHNAAVLSVNFKPDGSTLISSSADRTVLLWPLSLDDLLQQGCSWLDNYLQKEPTTATQIGCKAQSSM